jgi:hypothetical protein
VNDQLKQNTFVRGLLPLIQRAVRSTTKTGDDLKILKDAAVKAERDLAEMLESERLRGGFA